MYFTSNFACVIIKQLAVGALRRRLLGRTHQREDIYLDNPAKGNSLWQFLLKRLVIIIIVVLMCILAYHTGKRITGCTVMADEAMTARINYAFSLNGMAEDSALKRYFTPRMINSGYLQELKERYSHFTITGFNQNSSVKWNWSWPGSNTAYVQVTEKVPTISGEAKNRDETPDISIPEWKDGVYLVTLKRVEETVKGQTVEKWLVDGIEYLEPAPTRTPWPSETPGTSETPGASETPAPTTPGPTDSPVPSAGVGQ